MVKYCEKCGAKNRDDTRFCESCGAPLPKVTRAPAEKRAEAPKVPVRPRAGKPRVVPVIAIAAIVGIVVVIAVLALTIVLRFGETGPEDVVRSYAAAIEKGDFAKSRELCTGDTMDYYNNIQEASYNQIKSAYPNFTYKIEILELRSISETDTGATLYCREKEIISNAESYNNTAEYSGNIYLTKVGDKWKISDMALT